MGLIEDCIEFLADIEKMYDLANKSMWLMEQLDGFVRTIWPQFNEQNVAEIVVKMREGEYWDWDHGRRNRKCNVIIPEDWRPQSSEQYMEMVKHPVGYFNRPLYTAMTVNDSDSLLQIWNETSRNVRIRVLGNVDEIRELVNEPNIRVQALGNEIREGVFEEKAWKMGQFEGLINTVWKEMTVEDLNAMVDEMRRCNDAKYWEVIPDEWFPKSHEEYMEMLKDPEGYD